MEAQAVARQAFEAAYLAAAPLCEDQRALKRALREAAATLLAKLEAAQATEEMIVTAFEEVENRPIHVLS